MRSTQHAPAASRPSPTEHDLVSLITRANQQPDDHLLESQAELEIEENPDLAAEAALPTPEAEEAPPPEDENADPVVESGPLDGRSGA